MEEIFKNIENFEGLYQISNTGKIKSFYNRNKNKIFLTPRILGGYYSVTLWKNKKPSHKSVARLIAGAFLDNKNNLPQVNHIDGNKLNNNIKNLEWCTPAYNTQHAHKLGLIDRRGEKNHRNTKIHNEDVLMIRKMANNGINQRAIAKKFNIYQSYVSRIVNGVKWGHIT